MLHVNSVNSVNSANSYSAVLPPSPMVFLVKSLYLGGLTFQFLGLPIGPLCHCHDNNLPNHISYRLFQGIFYSLVLTNKSSLTASKLKGLDNL